MTASASGTLAVVNVYVDSTSAASTMMVGIYADDAGSPGTLLAQGTLLSPVAGAWNAVTLSSQASYVGGAAEAGQYSAMDFGST